VKRPLSVVTLKLDSEINSGNKLGNDYIGPLKSNKLQQTYHLSFLTILIQNKDR